MTNNKYIKLNLGCGAHVAEGWVNVDCSPNSLLAKIPFYEVIKKILFQLNLISETAKDATWSSTVLFCDLAKSFPHISPNSCDEIYSSHFLEHIQRENAQELLKKCNVALKSGGILRIAVPDLYAEAKLYVEKIDKAFKEGYEDCTASEEFIRHMVSREKRHAHLWMYDFFSLSEMLKKTGFINMEQMRFRQSKIVDINLVENREDSLFIECTK